MLYYNFESIQFECVMFALWNIWKVHYEIGVTFEILYLIHMRMDKFSHDV